MSDDLLSADHTLTRLPLTLCVADCTFQGPTWNGGACATCGSTVEDELGVGVPVRLPESPGGCAGEAAAPMV